MQKFIKEYQKYLIFVLPVVVLFFLLRLPNLTLQPIFADEAIYIRWAQVMRSEPTLRFLPLSDGKTPLFMWAMMPMFKIFDDPLFAGRFLSIVSGFVTMIGVLVMGWRVFSPKVGIWSALIYSLTPYTVFFDRMALVDSMLAAFILWALIIALWLAKSPRLDLAMILGYLLGGALLVKTPAMISILGLPFTILGSNFKNTSRGLLVKLLFFWVIALVITVGIYNALRLGPGFTQLSGRNADYVFSPSELVGRPLDPFIPHLNDILDWFPKLLSWPIILLILIGTIFILVKRNKVGISLLLWSVVPMMVLMAFLKTFTARYLLFAIPPLLVVAGFGVVQLSDSKKKLRVFLSVLILVAILAAALPFNYSLLTNPQLANLPKTERRGYLEDWTAGYGLKDIAEFLLEYQKTNTVVVGTEGSFGTLPDGLQIYLDKSNIAIIGGKATISAQLRNTAKEHGTFFVANRNRVAGQLDNVKLIKEYEKADPPDNLPRDAIMLFQVLPERQP